LLAFEWTTSDSVNVDLAQTAEVKVEQEIVPITTRDEVKPPEPPKQVTVSDVIKVVDDTKSNNFDLYVAIGGGSTIDTAKVVSLMHTFGGDLFDYINRPIGKAVPLKGSIRPVISNSHNSRDRRRINANSSDGCY